MKTNVTTRVRGAASRPVKAASQARTRSSPLSANAAAAGVAARAVFSRSHPLPTLSSSSLACTTTSVVTRQQQRRSSDVRTSASSSASPSTSSGVNWKLVSYFALWYAFNIVFNILNKSTLNIFPKPWLLSTIQLGKYSHSLKEEKFPKTLSTLFGGFGFLRDVRFLIVLIVALTDSIRFFFFSSLPKTQVLVCYGCQACGY